MLGLVTDAVVKEQEKKPSYRKGVQNLMNVLWQVLAKDSLSADIEVLHHWI